MVSFFIDVGLLIIGYIITNYFYVFLMNFVINKDFCSYLNDKYKLDILNLKIFSFLFLTYFLYKFDFIGLDSLFFEHDKIKSFFNLSFTTKLISSMVIYFICKILIFIVEAFNDFQKLSFNKPNTLINNYLKVFNFIIFISGFILIISIWMEIKVITLIAGLSTASAVFALIFRDFITGVITSISSANSNLARIGDYISLEKHNVKGTITDISITTVKLNCDDCNIISFPSYWLINDVVKNYWLSKEEHVKFIELCFYINLYDLHKVDLYKVEEIIKSNSNFYKDKSIIIKFENSSYNIGTLICNFFVCLKEYKEIEESKLYIYSNIGEYLSTLELKTDYFKDRLLLNN